MRILLVSYYFPPFNTIGAVRVGKTAAHLRRLGHEVRVLTARDQPLLPSLPLEIPSEHVTATAWLDVNRPIEMVLGGRRRVAERGFAPPAVGRSWFKRLGALYRSLLNLPDGQIGWLPFALAAGHKLCREFQPELILASSTPPTSLLVGAALAKQHAIPWVAELRDLWVGELGYSHPAWRRWFEKRLERRVLASAAGMVTVSEPLARQLRAEHRQPVAIVLNGFDPHDFARPAPTPSSALPLRLVYTGMIYEGRRDCESLLAALAELGPEAAQIRVEFYGRYLSNVQALATQYGVGHLVETHASVGYREALALQQSADLLLMLLERGPRARGAYSGKLFEYLGARRPILALGDATSLPGRLITQRRAGVVLDLPRAIAEHLRQRLSEKRAGAIAPIAATAGRGLSRQDQTRRLALFLERILGLPTARSTPDRSTNHPVNDRLGRVPVAV